MSCVLLPALLCAAIAQQTPSPKWVATRVYQKQVLPFLPETVEPGVKAAIAMLESCCDGDSKPDAAHQKELDEALKGDHVRVVFTLPETTKVMGKKVQYTQLVFGGGGVFWLTTPGGEVLRYTKYDYEKSKPFGEWFRSLSYR